MRRDRYQQGHLWGDRGKWWLRYSEKHADGTVRRPVVEVGTVEQYPTKKKARVRANEIMAEVNEAAAVTRFEHLCDHYERNGTSHLQTYSKLVYQSHIRALKAKFGKERIDDLASANGRARIEEWLNGQAMSAAHRRKHKAVLRLLFRHALRKDFLRGTNPIDLIDLHNLPSNTKPKRRRELISAEQYQALQNSDLCLLDKTILAIEAMTGVRTCEALGLKWEDVSFSERKIHVHRSVKGPHIDERPKTAGSLRTVWLSEKLLNALLRWKAAEPIINGWVFGSPRTGRPLNSSEIRRRIKSVAAGFGFDYKGFGLHNNRHTFNHNLEVAGASERERMRALGHTNLQTNRKYGEEFDHAASLAPVVEKVVGILERKVQ